MTSVEKRRVSPAHLPVLAFLVLVAALVVYQAVNAAHIESVEDFLLEWGSYGEEHGEFKYPSGIASDGDGNVYVVDDLNSRVQKFDSDGAFLRMWGYGVNTGTNTFEICTSTTIPCFEGRYGPNPGQFKRPRGIAVDSGGNVYVADFSNNRIEKFTSKGNFLTQWGYVGDGSGQFRGVHDVAVDAAGLVYTVESYNHRVQAFNAVGNFDAMWGWGVRTGAGAFEICTSAADSCYPGTSGSGKGQFDTPVGIAVDEEGYIYVTELENNRVQKFRNDGEYDDLWGTSGTGKGQFDRPRGITADSSGNLIVTDTEQNRIQRFGNGGAFLSMQGWGVKTGASASEVCTASDPFCQAGISGGGDGQFYGPQDLAVSDCSAVYVADTWNHRIQKLGKWCVHLPLILR